MLAIQNDIKKILQNRKRNSNLRFLPKNRNLGIDFSSNDYLGFSKSLSFRREIEEQFYTNQDSPYVGSTGSRLLTGHRDLIENLEKSIANFHIADEGLIFNSGYLANIGLLSCIATEKDYFIIDSSVHASIWQGVQLGLAKNLVFKHGDMNHLESRLKRANNLGRRIFICVESIYSMEGKVTPLKEILDLAEKYSAYLIVDEAHSTGVFGNKGEGIAVELGVEKRIFARVHTFGKALGTFGAIVLASKTLKEFLINFSKPFIYTTALPIYNYLAIQVAYQRINRTNSDLQNLRKLIKYFKSKIQSQALPIPTTETHIQYIHVGCPIAADNISLSFREAGLDVRALKYPTVRKGKEGLRICLHSFNSLNEIDLLVEKLASNIHLIFNEAIT
ncbi:MAG: 8-amino-7-oxononanoate synthase [Chlamydiae bacterium]|nr:8-amino-7-oxononanoate synthase [Chlamydiota bacterium]